jgi:hypothetical protein
VVYAYDGGNHEPSVVKLTWGALLFYGRLKTMSVEFTVFEPGGDPLRARAKMSFAGFMSDREESLRAKRASPDLSHVVVVRKGDTLPLLCHRIYKDVSYYLDVARYNDLSEVGHLEPGTRISLPPLQPRRKAGRGSDSVRTYPRHRPARVRRDP